MKTNLETFPELNESLPMITRLKDYWYKTQEWLENHGKELRERVNQHNKAADEEDGYAEEMQHRALADAFKEILGK